MKKKYFVVRPAILCQTFFDLRRELVPFLRIHVRVHANEMNLAHQYPASFIKSIHQSTGMIAYQSPTFNVPRFFAITTPV